VAVLTDALEGIVNIVAGFIGLFSIWIAARPKDDDHPYGHGKAEFISSALEGLMITLAGLWMVFEAVERLIVPHELEKLDIGIIIIVVAGMANLAMGRIAIAYGKKYNSLVLNSAGNHLQADAMAAIALILGLFIMFITGNKLVWLDSVVAVFFARNIIVAGIRVIRKALSGIMDETDPSLLAKVVAIFSLNKKSQWVALEQTVAINHGSTLHVKANLVVPRFFKVSDADAEVIDFTNALKQGLGSKADVHIHIEGCQDCHCRKCTMQICDLRTEEFS
jgi:cation diffusion facilitator family transporter